MIDYAGAIWLPNNNCFVGRNGLSPKWLILHGTAGGTSAQSIAQYFKGTEGGSNPVSAHYAVDEQGVIYQCTKESDGAWANGVVTTGHDPWWNADGNPNPNNVTISIEHVKPDSANATPITPAQQAASFALIKDICQRNGIPMRPADAHGGITGHYSIDPVNRARCPGNYPWAELWTYLNGETPMTIDLSNPVIAQYFSATQDSQIWQCKNGFLLGHGMLSFYQKFGGDALCGLTYLGLPLGNEMPILNKAGTTTGAVYQRFERGVLVYDPQHVYDAPPGAGPTYMAHIDSGVGQDPRVAQLDQLQAQIDQLKALLASSNLGQIASIGKQIQDDIALIMKLSQVQ